MLILFLIYVRFLFLSLINLRKGSFARIFRSIVRIIILSSLDSIIHGTSGINRRYYTITDCITDYIIISNIISNTISTLKDTRYKIHA